jgi:hypothetical protein
MLAKALLQKSRRAKIALRENMRSQQAVDAKIVIGTQSRNQELYNAQHVKQVHFQKSQQQHARLARQGSI